MRVFRAVRRISPLRNVKFYLVAVAMALLTKLTSFWRTEIPSLLEISLDEVINGLDRGIFTSADLVSAYIKRIEEVDGVYKSVIQVNPEALFIARSLDEEAKASGRRGHLHGVPILLKDNIVTLDRMEGTSGSHALLGARPAHESTVAQKLRDAGAVLLGKTNLSEWANARWTNASTGWSPRGGQCTGPFYPRMKASGSSTGSAVATILGLAFASLGTETGGSIIGPAGKASVVGLKPTTGLVSRDGTVPHTRSRDTVGPLTRSVKDAATILSAIAGKSLRDSLTSAIPFSQIPDYAASCRSTNLHGVRIGIPREHFGKLDPDVSQAFEKAIAALQSAGAEIIDSVQLQAADQWQSYTSTERMLLIYSELASTVSEYLRNLASNPHDLHTMEDLIAYTKTAPEEGFPDRDVSKFELSLNHTHYASQTHKEMLEMCKHIAADGGIAGALDRLGLDVLVAPATASLPLWFASFGNSPVIAVPLGFSAPDTPVVKDPLGDLITSAPGIPYSISFFARRFEEEALFKVAYAFEQMHDKGSSKMWKIPVTDLKDIVHTRTPVDKSPKI